MDDGHRLTVCIELSQSMRMEAPVGGVQGGNPFDQALALAVDRPELLRTRQYLVEQGAAGAWCREDDEGAIDDTAVEPALPGLGHRSIRR
jgi:hypothetical protein